MSFDYTTSIPPGFRLSSAIPASAAANAATASISNWLRNFNQQFLPFEKIVNNGLYSVMEKKIDEITPLLREGQMFLSANLPYAGIISMINDLVRPRVGQIQAACAAAQMKLADHPQEKRQDQKLEKLWVELNLPASILEQHADCARFLIESKLGFAIIGYREIGRNDHDLKVDPVDGHPMLKMNGQWTRWETISREVYYNKDEEQIKSRNNPDRYWNYYNDGLVIGNRFKPGRCFPIYQLTADQYRKILEHAKKFYETNEEIDPGILKDCVIQFFSSPRRESLVEKGSLLGKIVGSPLLDNVHRNIPVHVGVRIILPDGKVYSFGVHMPPDQQNQLLTNFFSNYLTTGNAKIPMVDYEEFRKHEGRMVTSIPLTSGRARKILERIDELNAKQMRLQYTRQNCSQFVLEAIQMAGYSVDTRTTCLDILATSLPSPDQIPLVAKVWTYTKKFWARLPSFLTKPVEFMASTLFYVPRKMGTILTNLLVLKMGAAKYTTPLEDGRPDEEFYDKRQIQSFSRLIRSWTDIFRDETNAVYHTKNFIDWQKAQKSTFIDPYSGRPKLSIIPPG